jgi:hypothetical protein
VIDLHILEVIWKKDRIKHTIGMKSRRKNRGREKIPAKQNNII